MRNSETPREQQVVAEGFVAKHLVELCRELVAFNDTGLFGTGKAHELRQMCSFAGASAQSLAIGMVEMAAVRAVAAPELAPLAEADAKLARRFADSIYDSKVEPPTRDGMLRLAALGLVAEVKPGQFAETPAMRAHGF